MISTEKLSRFTVGSLPDDLSRVFPRDEDIPARVRLDSCLDQTRVLFDGRIVPWEGRRRDVFSPILIRRSNALTRTKVGSYPEMTGREALRALDAARRAFSSGNGKWPSLPLSLRVRSTERFLDGLAKRKEDIVKTLVWEIAKPYSEVEDEFQRTIDFIERVIRIARQKEKEARSLKREKGIIGLVHDEPYGVALCLGPYNYPLFETFSLAFPALLAGNCVIIKPPKFGVLFFDHLLESFAECYPPGVVGFISGEGRTIVEPLMRSGEVDVFAFIGTRPTANRLMGLHPRKNRLLSLLGLGAKNPVIILPDADLEVAVREAVLGALAFNGQRCAALKIFFVHEAVRKAFEKRMSEELSATRIGLPWTAGVRVTPMTDPARVPYLQELVEDAVRQGSRVVNRNGGRSLRSLFVPTLLFPVDSRMKIYWEEQFGPVIPLVPYDKIEAPIDYVIRSPFGQQLSVFGTEVRSLARLVHSVKSQVSRININSKCQRGPDLFPFSGRKDSAKGDFSAPEIMSSFAAKTVVTARENETSEALFRSLQRLDARARERKRRYP
jgi:glyceraldehyde-3-phosphate dehydrogenase (NADP+)